MSEWEPLEPGARRPRDSRRARPGDRSLAPVSRRSVSTPSPERDTTPAPAHVLSDAAWAPVSPDLEGFIRIEDLFGILRRRRRVLLAAFALVAIPSVFAALSQVPLYESTTLLFVKFGREFVYRAEVGEEQIFINRDQQTVINSELQILSSESVMSDAVKTVGIEALYPDLVPEEGVDDEVVQRATQIFRANLSAYAVPDADVIRVSFRHEDPELAAEGVTAAVDHFMEKHVEIFSDREAISFLDEKVPTYRKQLEASEEALRDFQARYPDFSPTAPRESLQREREQVSAQLVETRDEITRVRSEPEPQAIAAARAKLLELQLQEQRMGRGMSRDLELIRKEIALVEAFLDSRVGATGSRHRTRLAHLGAEQKRLEAKLAELDAMFGQLPQLVREHEELVRKRDVAEQRYRTSAKRLADSRLADELNRTERAANIRILTPGQVPLAPVTLRREMLMAFGLALALTVAILTTFLVEFLSPTRA